MSRKLAVKSAVFLACVAGSALPLFGQIGGVPTQGGSPFSPWLNLYQRKGGPLDNYHMFVQPAQEQQNALQNLQYGVQHNASAVNSVADQFSSQAEAYSAAGSPTGNAAGFMNYGHYFNNTSSGNQGSGAFGLPGTGGFGRPGGVGQFGTPGLGGATAGMGIPNPAAFGQGIGGLGAGY
jgi:hypothetical protein